MSTELSTRDQCEALARAGFAAVEADHVVVSMLDTAGGTTRFAGNEVIQNVDTRRGSVTVEVHLGSRRGTVTTSEFSAESVSAAARRAAEITQLMPDDPEYIAPLGKQEFPILPTEREETRAAGPAERRDRVAIALDQCRSAAVDGAGVFETYTSSVGVFATTGLAAFERRTFANMSLTATARDSSGWARDQQRSIDDVDVANVASRAIEKARLGANPRPEPAGRRTVILEPAAMQGLVRFLLRYLGGKAYDRGTTPLRGMLGKQFVDARLTLQNRPDHPSLLGRGFNDAGIPTDYHRWIENGVLSRLNYDRFSAREKGVSPGFRPDAVHLSGGEGDHATLSDLIASTREAILVTNFWYIREVNPRDATLSGVTRDGAYLVRDGRVSHAVNDFRWHDSPLGVLNRVSAMTEPLDAIAIKGEKMMLPAMRIDDFHFSSATRA